MLLHRRVGRDSRMLGNHRLNKKDDYNRRNRKALASPVTSVGGGERHKRRTAFGGMRTRTCLAGRAHSQKGHVRAPNHTPATARSASEVQYYIQLVPLRRVHFTARHDCGAPARARLSFAAGRIRHPLQRNRPNLVCSFSGRNSPLQLTALFLHVDSIR